MHMQYMIIRVRLEAWYRDGCLAHNLSEHEILVIRLQLRWKCQRPGARATSLADVLRIMCRLSLRLELCAGTSALSFVCPRATPPHTGQ